MSPSLRTAPLLLALVTSLTPPQQAIAQEGFCAVSDELTCVPSDPSYRPDADVVIPVVFHVITKTNGEGMVTQDQIEDQIDILNIAFDPASTSPPAPGTLPRFTFVLAGVSRVVNDDWFSTTSAQPEPVMRALRVEPEHVLNVYTVSGSLGHAGFVRYLPWQQPEDHFAHGVLMRYTSMPGGGAPGLEEGDVLVHEVGHYLGLTHLQGQCDPQGCSEPGGDCVCDTPPLNKNPWDTGPPHCETAPASTGCGGIMTPELTNNYMASGTVDACRTLFTLGQYERMLDITGQYKPSLGEPPPVVWGTNNTGPDLTHTYPAGTMLQGTDVYVLPGTTLETLGTVTLESLGAGGDPANLFVGGAHVGPSGAVLALREGATYTVRHPGDADSGDNDGYAGTFDVADTGSRLVADVGATLRLSAGAHGFATDAVLGKVTDALFPGAGSTYVVEPSAMLRFAPGRRLDAYGTLNASGATFTERDAGQGWRGIRFNAGSGGSISDSFVERVGLQDELNSYAVSIYSASPTISGTEIRLSTPGSASGGVYVSNSTAFPVLTDNEIHDLTGDGIVLDNSAKARLIENIIELNDGRGLVGGYNTEAFLSGPLGSLLPANLIQENDGYGVHATSGAYLNLGYFYYPQGGYHADGFNSVTDNGNIGLGAQSTGRVVAGSLTAQRKNRFFRNAIGSGTPYDAVSVGSSSPVYARCDWWNDTTPPFRTLELSGGIVDDAWYLLQDPYVNPNPDCVEGPGLRAPGGSAGQARGGLPEDGDDGEGSALDLLLAGVEVAPSNPAVALALFAEVVAGWPEDPAAAAALSETGRLATQANASSLVEASALALLEAEAGGDRPDLQAAALGALAAARHREDDGEGALAAAAALVALGDSLAAAGGSFMDGGGALLFGHVAQVYLYAETGRLEEAAAALETLEAVAPGSAEAALARWHLDGLTEVVNGEAGLRIAVPEMAATSQMPALGRAPEAGFRLEPARPNPVRGSSSGVAVPFVLSVQAYVRVVLYDVLGRDVAVLANGAYAAGRYSADLDAGAGLAPGTYLVRAVVQHGAGRLLAQTQRLTILR
jgi:parallel beta-helix repeat protein